MSNIYIQEPPTHGKVLLETTVGDIDIELWSREAPKACRNFVQLCMEGYYDNTLFHRLVKGFIVQGGDPTGTGSGGNSIWGKPFKDEIHSRLRFVRRGLVAMANAGRDDNGSQFFFTLGPTPELQNKHTIFGKIAGDTIYNMLKLEEGLLDQEERPLYPHKITKTRILSNPFDDIVPRQAIKTLSEKNEKKGKKGSSGTATKNFNLLSFGGEAEEEEEEMGIINKQFFSGKSKSSHDLICDPKLSSQPAVIESQPSLPVTAYSDDSESSPHRSAQVETEGEKLTDTTLTEKLSKVKEKLSSKKKSNSVSGANSKKTENAVSEEYYLGKEDKEAEARRLQGIRKEIRELKKSMRKEKEIVEEEKVEIKRKETALNSVITEFMEEQALYKGKKAEVRKKGDEREAQTLALLAKFKNKIEVAKETFQDGDIAQGTANIEDKAADENSQDISWLAKSLHNEKEELTLAKDANLKSDDWFEIYDPRNPLNKRRREESKNIEKIKKLKPID